MKKTTKHILLVISFFLLGTSFLSAQTGRSWWDSLSPEWKKVIQKQQFKGKDVNPTDEQLEQIINMTFIDITGNKEIKDLKPLESLSLLEIVRCGGTGIKSLEGLNGAINLRELDCSNNDYISSLSEISGLNNLTKINCGNTMVKSLRPIMDMKKLTELDVHLCTIIDLNSIRGLRNLVKLNVSENQSLFSLEGVERLGNLTELSCSNTRITSLAPLAKLPMLEFLDCSKSPIKTLKPIQLVKTLKEVNVSKTEISGGSLDYMLGHSNLTMFRAKSIDISEEDLVDFEKLMQKKNKDATIIITSKY